MASSTLGEDDQAALKTRYLLNALTGYSPLIYDLDVKGTDYNDFIEICRKVWEAKDKNPQLVTNLVSIYFNAEGLKFYKFYVLIKSTPLSKLLVYLYESPTLLICKFQDEESAHVIFFLPIYYWNMFMFCVTLEIFKH